MQLVANMTLILYLSLGHGKELGQGVEAAEVCLPMLLSVIVVCIDRVRQRLAPELQDNLLGAHRRWMFENVAPALRPSPAFKTALLEAGDKDVSNVLAAADILRPLPEVARFINWIYWTEYLLLASSGFFWLVKGQGKNWQERLISEAILTGSTWLVGVTVREFVSAKMRKLEARPRSIQNIKHLEFHLLRFWRSFRSFNMRSTRLGNELAEGLGQMEFLQHLPKDTQLWEQLMRLKHAFPDPLPAERPGGVEAADFEGAPVLPEYIREYEAGNITPFTLTQQLTLGFPCDEEGVSSRAKKDKCLNPVLRLWHRLLVSGWVQLPFLVRKFSSGGNGPTWLSILVDLAWVFGGVFGFMPAFVVAPEEFRLFCQRMRSAHMSLNLMLQGQQRAVGRGLPYIDPAHNRSITTWVEIRDVLTTGFGNSKVMKEIQIGLSVVSLLLIPASVVGWSHWAKTWEPGLLTWSAVFVLCSGQSVLLGLAHAYRLNSALDEQKDLVRAFCLQASSDEVYATLRRDAETAQTCEFSARYAQSLLPVLESKTQSFKLFGIVLNGTGLSTVFSAVQTVCCYTFKQLASSYFKAHHE